MKRKPDEIVVDEGIMEGDDMEMKWYEKVLNNVSTHKIIYIGAAIGVITIGVIAKVATVIFSEDDNIEISSDEDSFTVTDREVE